MSIRRAVVLVISAAACAVLLTDFIRVKDPGLVVGEVAPLDVVAPFNFQFDDVAATEHLREEAADQIPLVYDYDATLTRRLQDRVSESFEKGRADFLAASLELLSDPEEAMAPSSTGEEPDGRDLPAEIIGQLGQDFVMELGLSLHPDEVETIVRSGFDLGIEQLANGWLAEVMGDMVVTDRSVLPAQVQVITIVRQDFDGVTEDRLSDQTPIRTAEEARNQVAFKVMEAYDEGQPEVVRVAQAIARAAVRGNLSYNEFQTESRRQAARRGVTPVVLTMARGTTLVRSGDVVTDRQLDITQTTREERGEKELWTVSGSLFVLCLLLFLSVTLFASNFIKKFSARPRDIEACGVLLLLVLALARMLVEVSGPVAAAAAIDFAPQSVWFLVPLAV